MSSNCLSSMGDSDYSLPSIAGKPCWALLLFGDQEEEVSRMYESVPKMIGLHLEDVIHQQIDNPYLNARRWLLIRMNSCITGPSELTDSDFEGSSGVSSDDAYDDALIEAAIPQLKDMPNMPTEFVKAGIQAASMPPQGTAHLPSPATPVLVFVIAKICCICWTKIIQSGYWV